MSEGIIEALQLPAPDIHLSGGSGSHAVQTARILEEYERCLLRLRPRATVLFGDVNGTLACALAAAKLAVPIVHVEAGLRSFDRSMPEEVNRVLTDALAGLLLVTEPAGVENLAREGISGDRVRLVGNTMVDTLQRHLPTARSRRTAVALGLADGGYGLVTMHRPSNVDNPDTLRHLLGLFGELAQELPLVFPVHPRTRDAIQALGAHVAEWEELYCTPPHAA
jgi:UDP-N-acetylglucosamine 2-epimerase (non-hydrolysing)